MIIKLIKKNLAFLAPMLVLVMVAFAGIAHATPLYFVPTTQLAAATSSVTYLISGGNATTTSFDAYAGGQPYAIDKGVLLLQTAASSTSSVLNVTFQYSQDNIDWYGDDLFTITNASTTQPYTISSNVSYSWTAAGTATSSKALNVNFPTRYVRAILSQSGAAGALWWQFVPQRQSH